MDADAQLEVCEWLVADTEVLDGGEQVERHRTDLASVTVLIPLRQPGRHHVCVTNCLHLEYENIVSQTWKRHSLTHSLTHHFYQCFYCRGLDVGVKADKVFVPCTGQVV